jgi:hypothetical protein
VRPSMALSADSAPCAAWSWKSPLVMLSTNYFCFSASAWSGAPLNVPAAEN